MLLTGEQVKGLGEIVDRLVPAAELQWSEVKIEQQTDGQFATIQSNSAAGRYRWARTGWMWVPEA